MTAPGTPLDLDALEKVARAARAPLSMAAATWAKCPTTCAEGVDRCVAAGKCLREGTPVLSPGGSFLTIGADAPPAAIDPAAVLRLIEERRELVEALSDLLAACGPDHQCGDWAWQERASARAAILKATGDAK